VHIEDIEYFHNGTRMLGQLAVDDAHTGKRPAVLVSHEGSGLGKHAKTRARQLAEAGYVAFALDYFGDGKELPPEEVGPKLGALMGNSEWIRAVGGAGLDVLLASEYADASKVAAIGYCFGGTLSLELARGGADLAAVVGFHSGLQTANPGDAKNITAKVLVCIGADDDFIPAEQRLAFEAEMRAGGVDWRMNLYGNAVHSFTNPAADGTNPTVRYDKSADERSWRAMLDLFEEVF